MGHASGIISDFSFRWIAVFEEMKIIPIADELVALDHPVLVEADANRAKFFAPTADHAVEGLACFHFLSADGIHEIDRACTITAEHSGHLAFVDTYTTPGAGVNFHLRKVSEGGFRLQSELTEGDEEGFGGNMHIS